MNQIPIPIEELPERIAQVKTRAAAWLPARRTPGQAFGHFQLCPHAEVPDELNAATGALELWVLLGLPLSEEQRQQAVHHLKSFQNPVTGLVVDPSWTSRQMKPNPRQLSEGDTFFTMTTVAALRALGERFDHPISYLIGISPGDLLDRTDLSAGAHNPFAVGDYAALIQTNYRLGAPGAGDQWKALNRHLQIQQDPETGFWPAGCAAPKRWSIHAWRRRMTPSFIPGKPAMPATTLTWRMSSIPRAVSPPIVRKTWRTGRRAAYR